MLSAPPLLDRGVARVRASTEWFMKRISELDRSLGVLQVSLWAVLASPLIISLDVRGQRLTPACLALVANERVVAVHQDAAGIPGEAHWPSRASTHGTTTLAL